MALPSFQKTGVTTLSFAKGYVFPHTRPPRPRQKIGRAAGGQIYVATLGDRDQEFHLEFLHMPTSQRTAALAFLDDSRVDWSGNTFTFVDHDATSYTVRCLDYQETWIAHDSWNLSFHLMKEIL
jgi:hypothetical protein